MWINADASWAYSGRGCDEECQPYVMVEVLDASHTVIPGFLLYVALRVYYVSTVASMAHPCSCRPRIHVGASDSKLCSYCHMQRDAVVYMYAVGTGVNGLVG